MPIWRYGVDTSVLEFARGTFSIGWTQEHAVKRTLGRAYGRRIEQSDIDKFIEYIDDAKKKSGHPLDDYFKHGDDVDIMDQCELRQLLIDHLKWVNSEIRKMQEAHADVDDKLQNAEEQGSRGYFGRLIRLLGDEIRRMQEVHAVVNDALENARTETVPATLFVNGECKGSVPLKVVLSCPC